MHLECENKITIRNKVIGGADLLICMPLVATDEKALLKEAQTALVHKPDLFEWRVDTFGQRLDRNSCRDILSKLRGLIGNPALIFTCRSHAEGGLAKLSAVKREGLVTAAIQSGHADIIDIELSNNKAFIQNILKAVKKSSLHMILSYHNFEATPDPDYIIDTLFQAREMGADIAKVAVMPQDFEDVLTLMQATLMARKNGLKIPAIAISMGALGRLTRLAGKLFGSDITFASSETPSAPGQIPTRLLHQAIAALQQS